MKLSKAFWQTYKEIPADAEVPSHQLMMRAGLIHKSGAGLYNYLPFGLKSIQKVEKIVREEMNRAGAQEILMTMVTPGELWKSSGRWDLMTEMLKFKDKRDSDVCLSPTNEESVVDVFSKGVKSYKELPCNLYQMNTKFRDEIRPRFGLLRAREFIMKDAYTFHTDKACLDEVYAQMFAAYERILMRMGLEFVPVKADGGAMASSDSQTHEFQILADTGEDLLILSETGYAANIEKAETKRAPLDWNKDQKAIAVVDTPNMATIEDVCNFLKAPQHHSLKSLVYKGITGDKETFILAMLLGDDELNEIKLGAYLKSDHVMAATDNELKELQLEKGFIGPYSLKKEIKVVFDAEINLDASYVTGANQADKHFEGFVPSRDIKGYEVADLRQAKVGDLDKESGKPVYTKRGIEAGHIFQLGDKYTKSMNVSVLDQNGKTIHPLMGCYGMGITRVVAASIEQNHDEKGIVWPVSIAPADLHFVVIAKGDETQVQADKIYESLMKAGVDVVYDDRKAGPGFKFKDADLLGLPFQLVLGERDFKEDGMLKINRRKDGASIKVKPEEVIDRIQELLAVQLVLEDNTIQDKPADPFGA
ncbi:MAG: proline--tRNA ligase [Deltaproteobacteria bacterium]|nr:MAG: proline--tRNA ligase [Deltaproteobacteria bacterium]